MKIRNASALAMIALVRPGLSFTRNMEAKQEGNVNATLYHGGEYETLSYNPDPHYRKKDAHGKKDPYGINDNIPESSPEPSLKPDSVIRWAASGGGWLAMSTHMGFANLFRQAGLISSESSKLSAISSNSGGTWFTTQFFYSQTFFDNVMGSPDDLHQFVLDWMHSYKDFFGIFSSNIETSNAICDTLANLSEDIPILQFAVLLCFVSQGWADFVEGFLQKVSADYGDPEFVDRPCGAGNCIPALVETELLIQTAMSPTSTYNDFKVFDFKLSYFGPKGSDMVYSTLIPIQYSVKDDMYIYALNEADIPLSRQSAKRFLPFPNTFNYFDWEDKYFLYDEDNADGDLLTDPLSSLFPIGKGTLAEFFGGQTPTVKQLSAASSAAAGGLSGTTPSMLAQSLSWLFRGSDIARNAAITVINGLLNLPILGEIYDELSVCSQWPDKQCDINDARFVDGGYIDNFALVQNIAAYQSNEGDLTKTLKVIVTSGNTDENDFFTALFLSFFNSSLNEGVSPGDFNYEKTTEFEETLYAHLGPVPSPQIFEEELTFEGLKGLKKNVIDTSLTSSILSATTINNPNYGVKAGQKVQILLLEVNSNIPIILPDITTLDFFEEELADLTFDIASVGSEELLERINSFLLM